MTTPAAHSRSAVWVTWAAWRWKTDVQPASQSDSVQSEQRHVCWNRNVYSLFCYISFKFFKVESVHRSDSALAFSTLELADFTAVPSVGNTTDFTTTSRSSALQDSRVSGSTLCRFPKCWLGTSKVTTSMSQSQWESCSKTTGSTWISHESRVHRNTFVGFSQYKMEVFLVGFMTQRPHSRLNTNITTAWGWDSPTWSHCGCLRAAIAQKKRPNFSLRPDL